MFLNKQEDTKTNPFLLVAKIAAAASVRCVVCLSTIPVEESLKFLTALQPLLAEPAASLQKRTSLFL